MNKTIENLSSVIREIAAQEAEKHTDIVIGEIAEKNSDGTYDVFIVPDFVTPVTNIPNSSIYDFNIGEGCYVRKYNNQLQSSAIVDKIGFSQPRFGTGGEGSSSASGSLVAGKTSELQNDGSDGVHPFIDTSALLQTNPAYEPSTAKDKIFSAKAVSAGFTFLIGQVAEALDMTVLVNKEQNFTDSQKETARTNIGAASQGDIEGINNNIANCVQVNAQTFTEEQKTQARTNIGAASQTEMSTAADNINTLNTTVDALEQVALTANQKALVVNEYNKQLNLFKNKKLPTTYEGVTITPIGLSSYKITGTNTASRNWGFYHLADVSDLDPNKTYTLKLTVVSGTGECGIQGSTTAKQVTETGASLSNIYIMIPESQAFSDYVVTMMLVEGSTAADYIPYYGDIIHQAEIDNSVVKYSSSQSLTDEQKAQARTNIGALSSMDLSVWSQRATTEEDLNTLANIGNGKAYISRYNSSTANTPVANTYGNVISFRNSEGELTQIAMEVQSGKVYYRASATSTDFGTWKEIGGAIGETASGGGAIGNSATATSGGAIGNNATAMSGGAIGYEATAGTGGAVGSTAKATSGGAIGNNATATYGGAIGNGAKATYGGAVGNYAKAGNGFSGGDNAQVGQDSDGNYIDAIQLGTGTNNTPKTLQVYDHKVYDSTKDSLYCRLLNDITPAVIETLWYGTLSNDGSTTITVNTYSQYDYFILHGAVEGRFCNIIPNYNGTYGFTKKSDSYLDVNAFSLVYKDGSFTWGQSGFYPNGNFTFEDRTGTGYYSLYRIEGVKLCK